MTGKRFVLALALTLAGGAAASTELDAVRAEANLEKRSKLALDNASSALKSAREAGRSSTRSGPASSRCTMSYSRD